MSIGKWQSLYISQKSCNNLLFVDTLVFSCGILIPLMVEVVVVVCVSRGIAISYSKENVTFEVLTAILLKSSEKWYCVSGWVLLEISKDCGLFIFRVKWSFLILWLLFGLEDDSTMILCWKLLTQNTVSHPKRLESSNKMYCCSGLLRNSMYFQIYPHNIFKFVWSWSLKNKQLLLR